MQVCPLKTKYRGILQIRAHNVQLGSMGAYYGVLFFRFPHLDVFWLLFDYALFLFNILIVLGAPPISPPTWP